VRRVGTIQQYADGAAAVTPMCVKLKTVVVGVMGYSLLYSFSWPVNLYWFSYECMMVKFSFYLLDRPVLSLECSGM
jgi:hypothetical protein